ncbi:zinc finger CCCH type domain containing 1-like [Silurus meridionalis]|nr:zinc finger CCCH type domain containing 1-like [Silurus meridionalis]
MAEEAASVIGLICSRLGSVEFETLVQVAAVADLETVIEKSESLTIIQKNTNKTVLITSKLRRCRGECGETCSDLHLCKFYLLGQCNIHRCKYGHSLETQHNSEVLHQHGFQDLNRDQLRVILLLNDGSLLPNVCVAYNKGSDEFGKCPEKEACSRLHICEKYIRGQCDGSSECKRCHDFYEPHPWETLKARGVGGQLVGSLLLIYRNILTLREHRNAQGRSWTRSKENPKSGVRAKVSLQTNTDDVICLFSIRGICKREKCWRVHFGLPYKWEMEMDGVWMDLHNSEAIERDYCDPAKTQSVGCEPVRFDTMTRGLHRVRRLSTVSSVMEPNFRHTTKWIWYWKNEYNSWIQYGSVKEMHRLSSITSDELEKKYLHYLEDKTHEMVKFTAGKHCYELNFRDMKQRNDLSSSERAVRRRPFFVSLFDIRTTRIRRVPNSSSHLGVPGFWDKSAIPDSGFQRVFLDASHRDYIRVQELFNKTMKEFNILTIERVQNKELWEDFQTKKERMKKANSDKKYGEAERLLFHGTNARNIDAICRQNFDMKESGANATVYGEGCYFSRDAKYSTDYTDRYGDRSMFACRVLVGQYAKGAPHFRRPPSRDAAGNLYDSCVNTVHEPTIYVIFDRSQVYPEFLITYEKSSIPKDIRVICSNVSESSGISVSDVMSWDILSSASISTTRSPSDPAANPDKDVFLETNDAKSLTNVVTGAPKTDSKSSCDLTSHSRLLREFDQSLRTSKTIPGLTHLDPSSLTGNRAPSGIEETLQETVTACTSNSLDPSPRSPDKPKNLDASSITFFTEIENKTSKPSCAPGYNPSRSGSSSSSHETWSSRDVDQSFHIADDKLNVIQSACKFGSELSFGSTNTPEELFPPKPAQVSSSSSTSTGKSAQVLAISVRNPETFKQRSNPDLVATQRSSAHREAVRSNHSHPLSAAPDLEIHSSGTPFSIIPVFSDLSVTYRAGSSSAPEPSLSEGFSSVSFNGTQPPDVSAKQPPAKSPNPQNVPQAQSVKSSECVVQ